MNSVMIGDLRIDRVEEFDLLEGIHFLLANLPEGAVEKNLHWMAPAFLDPVKMMLKSCCHSWIIRTKHHNIMVDTCVSGEKHRPFMSQVHDLRWFSYMERLAEHGLTPADIDYVLCTHLHFDHVGWNTRLEDGRWVPTFPNAKYIFGRKEFQNLDKLMKSAEVDDKHALIGFEDSVLPIVAAGQAVLVDDGFAIDDQVSIELAPGHTEGNILVRARSREQGGIFTGDILHTPLQVPYPDVNSNFCALPELARATRRRVLEDCAEHGHLMLPAHFSAPYVGRVTARADAFDFHPGC